MARTRKSRQEYDDDMEGEWPPTPSKVRRTLWPEENSEMVSFEELAGVSETSTTLYSGAVRARASASNGGPGQYHLPTGQGGAAELISPVRSARSMQSPSSTQLFQKQRQQTPESQGWARDELWQIRHSFVEFVDQDSVAPAMLREDQQLKCKKEVRVMSDLVYSFPTREIDSGYTGFTNKHRDDRDSSHPSIDRNYRAEEMGTNPLDPKRPLRALQREPDRQFLLTVTKFKESLTAQQRSVEKDIGWSWNDLRGLGMTQTLVTPAMMTELYEGVKTGDVEEDEEFQQFVKVAVFLRKDGEKQLK